MPVGVYVVVDPPAHGILARAQAVGVPGIRPQVGRDLVGDERARHQRRCDRLLVQGGVEQLDLGARGQRLTGAQGGPIQGSDAPCTRRRAGVQG